MHCARDRLDSPGLDRRNGRRPASANARRIRPHRRGRCASPPAWRVNYRPDDPSPWQQYMETRSRTKAESLAAELRESGYQAQVVSDLSPLPQLYPDAAMYSASRYYPTSNYASDYNYYMFPNSQYNYGWYGGWNPWYRHRVYPSYWYNGGQYWPSWWWRGGGWNGGWTHNYWNAGWNGSHRNWNYSHYDRHSHNSYSAQHASSAHHGYYQHRATTGHHTAGHHAAARIPLKTKRTGARAQRSWSANRGQSRRRASGRGPCRGARRPRRRRTSRVGGPSRRRASRRPSRSLMQTARLITFSRSIPNDA